MVDREEIREISVGVMVYPYPKPSGQGQTTEGGTRAGTSHWWWDMGRDKPLPLRIMCKLSKGGFRTRPSGIVSGIKPQGLDQVVGGFGCGICLTEQFGCKCRGLGIVNNQRGMD